MPFHHHSPIIKRLFISEELFYLDLNRLLGASVFLALLYSFRATQINIDGLCDELVPAAYSAT